MITRLGFSFRLMAFFAVFWAFQANSQTTPTALNLQSGLWYGIPVTYNLVNGVPVYQGDILLGQVSPLPSAPNTSKISTAAATVAYSSYLWPKVNGVATVYYTIDAASASAATANINQAISQFNADFTGVIQWAPRTTQSVYVDINFSATDFSGQCEAEEGYQPTFSQPQPMQGSVSCTVGTILHEMGHVIGLWHEHTRSDRNSFVTVNFQNIIKGSQGNFDMQEDNSQNQGLYDYASVMQYPPFVQSRNGGPSIETIPPGMPLGSAEGMPTLSDYSAGDKEAIMRLYGAPPSQITVTSNPPGLTVTVDGASYTTPHAFSWALNSTHTLSVPNGVQTLTGNINNSTTSATFYYTYGRWNDNTAQTHTITVTPGDGEFGTPATSPQYSTYSASFIQLTPYTSAVNPTSPTPGTVSISPTPKAYSGASGVFLTARQQATLTASPNSGWNFYAYNSVAPYFWLPGGLSANPKTFYVPDTGNPIYTIAEFTQSPVYTVNVSPGSFSSNLYAYIDGNFFYTPKNFALPYDSSWTSGSSHTLNTDSPVYPYSYNSRYAFSSWSDGGAQLHTISSLPAGSTTYTATVTPQFQPATNFNFPPCGGSATITPASPTGDGFYPSGQVLTFTETAASGWSFAGWSDDLTNSISPTTLTATDETLVYANFNTTSIPLTITSLSPNAIAAGGGALTLTINGAGFTSNSVVYANGSYRTPTFVNSNTLQIPLAAADIASAGNFQLYVENYPTGSNGCAVFAYQSVYIYQGQGPLSLSSSSAAFGTATDGTSATPITITLNNVGTPAINLNTLSITGANAADFSINSSQSTCINGATLAPSASCTIVLNFKPSASGARSATLQISDNAGVNPQTIALSGTGLSATQVPLPLWTQIALAGILGLLIVRLRKTNSKFGGSHKMN